MFEPPNCLLFSTKKFRDAFFETPSAESTAVRPAKHRSPSWAGRFLGPDVRAELKRGRRGTTFFHRLHCSYFLVGYILGCPLVSLSSCVLFRVNFRQQALAPSFAQMLCIIDSTKSQMIGTNHHHAPCSTTIL